MSHSLLLLTILALTLVGYKGEAHTGSHYQHIGGVVEPRSLSKSKKPLASPYSGERIRMRGSGGYINSGVVEVYKDHNWRYICDEGWDHKDAAVACRSLGFSKGIISNETIDDKPLNIQGASAKFMLTRVQCHGTESDVLLCRHSYVNTCPGNRTASVACRVSNDGCPDDWTAGFGKCYNFYTKAKNIKLAASVCARENASLLTIDSVAENHFLSNILKNSLSPVQQWYTGGTKTKHGWKWNRYGLGYGANTEGYKRTRPAFTSTFDDIDINRWFPGWPLSKSRYEEPASIKRRNCLTLSDKFDGPTKRSMLVDYFYWKAANCSPSGGVDFICQIKSNKTEDDKQPEDCYIGDGSDYRGTASVSVQGSECINWDNSSLVNKRTHPGKGLGNHNYCRNPDKETRPWCWVDTNEVLFGYCKLPNCSELSSFPLPTITSPVSGIEIELVNGSVRSEGRVQVTRNNLSGSICDDGWDNTDASVVCRMLGYKGGGEAVNEGAFGPGDGPIWLDEVQCNGTETSLGSCPHGGWTKHDCEHEEDAGVRCFIYEQEETLPLASESSIKCGLRPFDSTPKQSRPTQSKYSTSRRSPQEVSFNDDTGKQKWWLKVNQKILGGNMALFGSQPWEARINIILGKNGDGSNIEQHHCGCAILSEFWLISAAHCFHNHKKSLFLVYVGDYNLNVTEEEQQSFEVSEIISHNGFDDSTKDYDVALIKIKPASDGNGIKYGFNVRPICLIDPDYNYLESTMCTISGWGNTQSNRHVYPEIMRTASVPLIDQKLCKYLHSKLGGGFLSQRMFCAGYIQGMTDTCDGDSGASIICKVNGAYTAVGVTSWGVGCGEPNYPGVYTRLTLFIPWIEATINTHSANEREAKLPLKP